MQPAGVLLDLARSRAATLGDGRLICIDGPAGSGKTTLAAAIGGLAPEARVLHMDDMYDGWHGLSTVADRLAGLLRPLARGEAGSYRRYDWIRGAFAETVTVEPGPLLVLEGVGSGAAAHADLVTTLAWVHAPRDVRLRRGIQRDGERLRPQWQRWQVDEAAMFAREDTQARADLVVDASASRCP